MGVRASFLLAVALSGLLFLAVSNGLFLWVGGWTGDLLIALLGGFSLISVASESARIEPRNVLQNEVLKLENARRDLARFLMNYSKQLPKVEFRPDRPWADWALKVEEAARQHPDEPDLILASIDASVRKTFSYSSPHEEAFVMQFVDFADFFAKQYREALERVGRTQRKLETSDLETAFVFLSPIFLAIATAIGVVKALT